MSSLARTQISLQRAPTPTNSQFIITSIKRNFSESARLRAASTQTQSDNLSKKSAAALLDWNTFFKLRASRRRYSLASSIITSFASTAIGVQVLSTQDIDTLAAQVMGLDPFIVLGIATAACGALGWLIGPILGNTLWGVVNRQYRSGIAIVSIPLRPPKIHGFSI
jgi:mitochondrial import inner membrane translocase subunit TIM23